MSELLTIKEVMDKFRVSRQTVHSWITKGKIKAIKIDKAVRIPASQFEMYDHIPRID
jgi:excisionase family DNA binding protein